jgi:hypothetical protein
LTPRLAKQSFASLRSQAELGNEVKSLEARRADAATLTNTSNGTSSELVPFVVPAHHSGLDRLGVPNELDLRVMTAVP